MVSKTSPQESFRSRHSLTAIFVCISVYDVLNLPRLISRRERMFYTAREKLFEVTTAEIADARANTESRPR